MYKRNKGQSDIDESIDAKVFETDLIPIFDKIKIEKDEAFHIASMDNIQEYESLFYNIYHGIVYNFFKMVEKKDRISYDEYNFLYENSITVRVFNGERTVSYGGTPIIIVSKYAEEKTNRLCEYIKPIYSNDILPLFVIKKPFVDSNRDLDLQIEERDNILKDTKKYINEKKEISFEDFDNL